MIFRNYNSFVSQAGKGAAKGLFICGLFLIGFAMLVWVLKDLFAFIAAGIFIIAGVGCCVSAVKAWYYANRFGKGRGDDQTAYRENVTIHYEERQS